MVPSKWDLDRSNWGQISGTEHTTTSVVPITAVKPLRGAMFNLFHKKVDPPQQRPPEQRAEEAFNSFSEALTVQSLTSLKAHIVAHKEAIAGKVVAKENRSVQFTEAVHSDVFAALARQLELMGRGEVTQDLKFAQIVGRNVANLAQELNLLCYPNPPKTPAITPQDFLTTVIENDDRLSASIKELSNNYLYGGAQILIPGTSDLFDVTTRELIGAVVAVVENRAVGDYQPITFIEMKDEIERSTLLQLVLY